MNPPLPIDGVLPPDLQGTLVRVGPGGEAAGALHAIELRDGQAVSYTVAASSADANVFWHAGSLLALAESGLPQRFSRLLEAQDFDGGLSEPIASHVRGDAATGGRILFRVEPGTESSSPALHLGEWDGVGALVHAQSVLLERATWQHDIGVTARHVVFLESPTEFGADLAAAGGDGDGGVAVPFRWTPGAEGWIGVTGRRDDGSAVRWIRQDPCLVTHVVGAYDEEGGEGEGGGGAVVLHVVRYPVPESGQPFDLDASVVGPAGIGASLIGGGLGVLERWRIEGTTCEQIQLDDRTVEYVTADPLCAAGAFRFGYGVETAPAVGHGGGNGNGAGAGGDEVDHFGLLQFDLARDEVRAWRPGEHRVASEPLFVRAADGTSDDEGWLLSVVHDAVRGAGDLYVLDASSFGRRGPQAVVHLPASLPFRSHGTWVGADRYR